MFYHSWKACGHNNWQSLCFMFYLVVSYEIFTAAARRALVVIKSKCLSFYMSFFLYVFLYVCHVTFSRPLIGQKYHRHWGRGRWAPQRQNIVETIHVNEKEIKRGWTELCHTRNQTKNEKCPPWNLHTAAVYVASHTFYLYTFTSMLTLNPKKYSLNFMCIGFGLTEII